MIREEVPHKQEPHRDALSSFIRENLASSAAKGSPCLNEEQDGSRREEITRMQYLHAGIDGNKSAEEQSSAFVPEILEIQQELTEKKIDQCQVQRAVTSMQSRAPTTKPLNQVK